MKFIFLSLVVVLAFLGGVWYVQERDPNARYAHITTFDECLEAGYSIMESYPRQCALPSGMAFVEDIGGDLAKSDIIRIDTPRPRHTVTSPLVIAGEARGAWYFEATFPIRLINEHGEAIAHGYATAEGEWMTEEFVPFTAELVFNRAEAGRTGTLVLEKSNPSGLPEHADDLRIPVQFGN